MNKNLLFQQEQWLRNKAEEYISDLNTLTSQLGQIFGDSEDIDQDLIERINDKIIQISHIRGQFVVTQKIRELGEQQ